LASTGLYGLRMGWDGMGWDTIRYDTSCAMFPMPEARKMTGMKRRREENEKKRKERGGTRVERRGEEQGGGEREAERIRKFRDSGLSLAGRRVGYGVVWCGAGMEEIEIEGVRRWIVGEA